MTNFKILLIYIVFIILLVQSAYLYSIRWNAVPWGSSLRDGLFFLAFYFIVLPLMILVSVIKCYVLRNNERAFIKFSFFIYTFLIALPAIDTFGSQIALGIGVVICLLMFGCMIFGSQIALGIGVVICLLMLGCMIVEFIKFEKRFK